MYKYSNVLLVRMIIVIFLLIISKFNFLSGFDVDLIFSLQQNFHSNVILVEKEHKNGKIIKKLLEHQKSTPRAFIGTFDLDNYSYKSFVASSSFSHYKNQLVIFDNKRNFIEKLIKVQKTNDANIISSFIWIFFIRDANETEKLNLLNIPYDSKFFRIKKINFSSFEVADVYQISADSPQIYSTYAIWENKELKLLRKNIFSNRKNLQGCAMQIASRFEPNTEMYNTSLIHWNLMSHVMNFTSRKIKLEWGFMFKNGTKTGTFEAVYNNIVDAGSANFVVLGERLNDFDFIFPTVLLQEALYVNTKQNLNWKAFISPFKNDIWMCIFGWMIFSYLLMCIINKMIISAFKYRFEDIIFNFIRAFCSQGRSIRTAKFSFYVCILMPYILGTLLLQHYSANLLAKITVEDSTPPFTNLEGVINDGTYKIACIKPSYNWGRLNDNNGTNAHKIKEMLVPIAFERLSSVEIFKDICKYRWVLFTRFPVSHVKVSCNIAILPQKFGLANDGIIVKKGFPYRKVMMKLLRHIQAVGLVKLYHKNSIIKRENDYTVQPLEFKTVLPAFLLLISFMSLSVIIFMFEEMIWKRRSPNCNFLKRP